MNNLLKNIARFILLVFLQVFVLNRINIHAYVNPYLYLLFILLLPFNTPRWLLLFCGLALGLTMDAFMNTPGLHATACVLIAYLRPFIINVLSPQGGFEETQQSPSISTMGFTPFLVYTIILVLIHHLVYFSLEVWGFSGIIYLGLKILISTAVTTALILLYELLFYSKK
jgi:rod shape-determining protein MreD